MTAGKLMKLSDIKANTNNPRLIKDDKFKKLLESVKSFPEMLELRPIVVNKDMVILWGNMRYKACKEAWLKEIPVIVADNLTEEQEREFLIKDNVSGGEWDWNILANEWNTEELEEWWLDVQFETVETEAEEDDFEVDEGIKTDIVLGDLFEIWPHRLLCWDSTNIDDVNKLMNGDKADMVFTDPPYWMFLDTDFSWMKNSLDFAKDKWFTWWKKYSAVIWDNEDFKPELINTVFINFWYCKEIFLWGADYYAELLEDKNDWSWIVWDKRGNNNDDIEKDLSSDKMYWSCFELCWSKNKHKRDIARVKWAGVFGTEKEFDHKRHHPTQKPILLSEWFIKKYSKENNNIVDLFWWSGSTMVACHQLNRKCFMSELDPKYCETITLRMLKLDKELKINRNWIDVTEEWRKKL